jgi:hypothetical protein
LVFVLTYDFVKICFDSTTLALDFFVSHFQEQRNRIFNFSLQRIRLFYRCVDGLFGLLNGLNSSALIAF